jgi:type I restriction enzyme S subunit
MARSQQVKEALEAIPPLLDQFRQSVLAAAFRGDLTADWKGQDNEELIDCNSPFTWKKERLGNVLKELKQGWSPKCEIFSSPCNDVWGVIKTTAVQSLRFIEGENKQLPSYLKPKPELEILEGDLLITRAGPRDRAGVTCLVSSVRPKLMVCDKVYRFRVKASYVLPLYLAYFLNSASTISLIDGLKTGMSDSGVNLTQEKFLAIPIWFPLIAEQQEIINKVKILFKIADEIEQQYREAKAYLDQLDQSILAKAFRGDLVPQDPNDEPASVLLERIQAERAKQEAAVKAAKKSTGKTTGQRSRKAKQQDLKSIQLGLPGVE